MNPLRKMMHRNIKVGTMSNVANLLTKQENEWLASETCKLKVDEPKIATFIAMLVRDAYQDDLESGEL